jgi:hypothetical protein
LVKFDGQTFSHDPLNLTNLHNASQAGISNDRSIGLQSRRVQAKKAKRGVVTLLQAHKSHNRITKRRKNSRSGLVYSSQDLRRGFNRLGKTIKNLPLRSERVRNLALRRLAKLHGANRPLVGGAAVKKEAEKK